MAYIETIFFLIQFFSSSMEVTEFSSQKFVSKHILLLQIC